MFKRQDTYTKTNRVWAGEVSGPLQLSPLLALDIRIAERCDLITRMSYAGDEGTINANGDSVQSETAALATIISL